MTEYEAVQEILGRCAALGIQAHHCNDSRHCQGSGFPDLVIASVHGLIFIEMKLDSFSTSKPKQTTWRHVLRASGVAALQMTVAQLPEILGMLDELANGPLSLVS